jgi:REP element-mobilizing transposase RayT
MSRKIRRFAPGAVIEITTRTIQGRFLLRPSRELIAVLHGIIGRALAKYGVRLHAFFFASNHFHLIVSIQNVRALALFMSYVNGNIARKVGRLHGWRERFWGRRYAAIEILDEEAQIARLRYLLSHGCKEGLVADPRDWPGASCVHALLHGGPVIGTWQNQTKAWYARRAGKRFDKHSHTERVEFELSPLPCWAHLGESERQARVAEMVRDIVRETRELNLRNGSTPIGANTIVAQDPHHRPDLPNKSPAPRCHTSSRELWIAFVEDYRDFAQRYHQAAVRWLDGFTDTVFPPNCFPPPLTFREPAEPALVPS